MPNPTVQLDLTASNEELDEALKRSEGVITRFGQKITAVFTKILELPNSLYQVIQNAFYKSINILQNFTYTVTNASKILVNYISILQQSAEQQKDLALTLKLTEQAAGYTTDQMVMYATYLEKVTRYSKDATVAAQQIIAHFKDIRGDNFLAATRASQDLATALKIDLATAANLVGNALQNPIEAFSQLEQNNIFFTKAQKQTVLALLEQNKVAEAQKIILDKLKDSFGGAAEAAGDTFVGALEKAKNRLFTVAQTIGNYLVTAINKLTGSTTSSLTTIEAYVKKIESLVPIVTAMIDEWIPKLLELAEVVKGKLIKAFDFFVEQVIIGVSAAEAAYDNFGKVVDIVHLKFQSTLENLKNNFQIIWTRVVPASLRWFQRIWDETMDVFLPNAFNRMIVKILATASKGLVGGMIKLLEFATGRWAAILYVKMQFLGAKMALQFLKAAIEAPMKMGGIYAKVFSAMFGLTGMGINAAGSAIGKRLAELDKQEQKDVTKAQTGTDMHEAFWETFFPQYARKRDLSAPDFAGMFEREETAKEKELKAAIEDLKDSLENDFADNQQVNREKADRLFALMNKLKEEMAEADRKFQEQFGAKPMQIGVGPNTAKDKYDRREAEEKKKREAEEKERSKRELARGQTQEKTFTSGLTGLEELWRNMSSGQVSELDKNTAAIKENTEAVNKANEKPETAREAAKRVQDFNKWFAEHNPQAQKARAAEQRRMGIRNRNARRAAARKQKPETELQKNTRKTIEGIKDLKFERERPEEYRHREAQKQHQRDLIKTAKKDREDRVAATKSQIAEMKKDREKHIAEMKENKGKPAEELARQKADRNETVRKQNKQHEDSSKHLKEIATNTRNTANAANATKKELEKKDKVKLGVV